MTMDLCHNTFDITQFRAALRRLKGLPETEHLVRFLKERIKDHTETLLVASNMETTYRMQGRIAALKEVLSELTDEKRTG